MKKTLYLTRGCQENDYLLKIWMTMKLSVFLLFVTLTQMIASGAYAQNTELTLQLKDVTVKDALKQIEDNSEFLFLYNSKLVDVDRRISIEAKNAKIEEILKNIFQESITSFTVIDRQIVLTSKSDLNNFKIDGDQQTTTVTGRVYDEKGAPMPGVNIQIEGTTIGTLTDFEGKYSIKIPNENSILNFSFIGYDFQKINVDGKAVINVSLVPSLESLDEVVVIGYGTAKRSNLLGSTSPVSVKEIKSVPSGRVDQVLQGRSPGIVIQNSDAGPNSQYNIRIRGSNSLSGSNDPLVVIDGFLGGNLSSINPNDIASLEVLKDASSTAIYGSRGSNGVILVTTKSGNSGKASVEYNGFVSIGQIAKKMDLLNAAEYAETVNANRSDLGVPRPFTDEQIAELKLNGGTDWQDVIYRNALMQTHQINITGGTENLKAYLSGDYIDNEGVVKNSSFQKYSIRANVTTSFGKKFNGGVNLSTSKEPVNIFV